ncbi:MAG: hypothetical protein ACTH54_13250 [Vagococcus salmoninarum]|uniref:hypothetical protein n=1 Tax=Vagococcus salmoninarum TaxID=2739 RepID=UPI003F9B7801
MLKLVWVPKRFKGFSFTRFHNEMKETMKEVKKRQHETHKMYADMLILQNKVANFSEEESAHNIKVIVNWMEKELEL